MSNLDYALASSSAGLVLVFLLTLPSAHGIVSHFRETKPKPDHAYEDKDGIATEESAAAYSATLPKALLSIFSVLGLLASIALAVLASINTASGMTVENWLTAGLGVRIRAYRSQKHLLIPSVSSPVSNFSNCAHKRFRQKLQSWYSCGCFIPASSCRPSPPSWRSGPR